MNDERFDELTRDLWAGVTRRRLLAALGGVAIAYRSATRAAANAKHGLTPTATAVPADRVPAGTYPTPLAEAYGICPPTGKGGDADLNMLKNRIDTVPDDAWLPVTIDAILALLEPAGTTKYMVNWPEDARKTVDRYLGAPVRMEAFVIGAKRSSGESTNCNSGDYGEDDEIDYHLVFAAVGESWDHAVVSELTPRVRIDHPAWTFDVLGGMVFEETPVRVSGWLMLDTRHSDNLGETRGTRWEIHPVMRIEVLRDGEWVDLDGASPHPEPPIDESPIPDETPMPTPTGASGDCDPSYPTVCIPPPPPDLNCSDIPYRNFKVLPPDPHGFDRDGDGVGCTG